MIDDFKVLGRNEPSLWPDRDFLARFVSYQPKFNCAPGKLYFRLYSLLSDAKIETIVLCPWLKRGGADKGALQFVEYYAKQGRVALITTLDAGCLGSRRRTKACRPSNSANWPRISRKTRG